MGQLKQVQLGILAALCTVIGLALLGPHQLGRLLGITSSSELGLTPAVVRKRIYFDLTKLSGKGAIKVSKARGWPHGRPLA